MTTKDWVIEVSRKAMKKTAQVERLRGTVGDTITDSAVEVFTGALLGSSYSSCF